MKRITLVLLAALLLVGGAAGQTSFVQSYGPVSSLVACTAAAGVATSTANAPCGGQGAMFQGANVLTHTVVWTAVAGSGSVSTCTLELETSAAGATFVLMTGSAQQTCTSSGSYTFQAAAGANYVKVNLNALTTTGTATVAINYYSTVSSIGTAGFPYVSFCGATSGATVNCANTTPPVTPRIIGGSATLASNASVVTFAPAFTGTATFTCVGNDITTRANPVQVITTSTTSVTITNTTGASDVIQWVCIGY